MRSTGGKTYYLSYRDARGAQRLHKLANAADVSPQQARVLCERARRTIAMGADPSVQRAQLRNAATVAEFFNTSYLPYIKSYKRSWSTDVSVFQNHILSVIGTDYMDAVTAERVGTVMRAVQSKLSAVTCNKVLILIRYMFNLAIRLRTAGIVVNPTAEHRLHKLSNHRERFLSAAETQHAQQRDCQMYACMIFATALPVFWSTRAAACMRCKRFWGMPAST